MGGSRFLDKEVEVGGLDFAQFRYVGGFVSKKFYQCTDIKLTQIKQCKCKQGLIRLKLPHSNTWNVCIGPQKLLSKTFITVPALLWRKVTNNKWQEATYPGGTQSLIRQACATGVLNLSPCSAVGKPKKNTLLWSYHSFPKSIVLYYNTISYRIVSYRIVWYRIVS